MSLTKTEKTAVSVVLGLTAIGLFVYIAKHAYGAPTPPPPGYANLYGRVTNAITGQPISGVLVTIDSRQAYTNDNGDYTLVDIQIGSYTATFSKSGYESGVKEIMVTLLEGNNTLNGSLTPVYVLPPAVKPTILKYFTRSAYAATSVYYSGWMGIQCPYLAPPVGTMWDISIYGSSLQIGVLIRNDDNVAHHYTPVISNNHWTSELTNDYVIDYLNIGTTEPAIIAPAPTGMPFSNNEYEPIDKIIPATGETLQPGEIGFIYTEVYSQSRRFNTVSLEIDCDGTKFAPDYIINGWYSY